MPPNLSKSRFVAGWQCHKLLWLKVHEPKAPELEVGKVLQDRFDQGVQVGTLAQGLFPGGVLIDLPYDDPWRVEATRKAIDDGVPAVFEATFIEDRVYVSIDVLERTANGFTLIEVKSSSKVKDDHIPDAAIHLGRAEGRDRCAASGADASQHRLPVTRTWAICSSDRITAQVEAFLPRITLMIATSSRCWRGWNPTFRLPPTAG